MPGRNIHRTYFKTSSGKLLGTFDFILKFVKIQILYYFHPIYAQY